jgi:DnaJ-class molecular chaperone
MYQKCPICDGQGIVSKPPYVAGDQNTWVSDRTSYPCKTCNGTGLIVAPTPNSEAKEANNENI